MATVHCLLRIGMVLLASACFAATACASPDIPPVDYPQIPERAGDAAGFVPPGWRLEHEARGRLDEDDRSDLLLLLRMDAAANRIEHDGMGASPFDTNPRMLVIAVAEGDGYRRVLADHRFIPRPHSPVYDDVLGDSPGDAIRIAVNRVFTVTLTSWASAGSWHSTSRSLGFRLQDGCARLLGFDEHDLHRGSGEITERSDNFLGGRGWTRSGHISDEGEAPKQWRRLPRRDAICLGDIGDGSGFQP